MSCKIQIIFKNRDKGLLLEEIQNITYNNEIFTTENFCKFSFNINEHGLVKIETTRNITMFDVYDVLHISIIK